MKRIKWKNRYLLLISLFFVLLTGVLVLVLGEISRFNYFVMWFLVMLFLSSQYYSDKCMEKLVDTYSLTSKIYLITTRGHRLLIKELEAKIKELEKKGRV